VRKLAIFMLVPLVLIAQSFGDRALCQTSNNASSSKTGNYHKVEDWGKYGISVGVQVTSFTQDSAGNCSEIKGRVTEFKIGQRDSPLISNEIMTEKGNSFINSTDLGKIKIGCGDLFHPVSIWLTEFQIKNLATLQAQAEKANAEEEKVKKEEKEYKESLQVAAAKSLEMALIHPGEFVMGSPENEKGRQPDETPHKVKITRPFEMAKYEVTQGLWEAVMGKNPASNVKCGLDCPVESVTWVEVQEFITTLNEKYPGKGYRLPTEAEWEFAARAGDSKPRYGNIDAIAWYKDNSRDSTHPVGQKRPNAWGLYNMFGNVWEFCSDVYAPYPRNAVTDPTGGPSSGSQRVFRGGSYFSTTGREPYTVVNGGIFEQKYYPAGRSLRAAFRDHVGEYDRNVAGGFRLARSVAGEH
jgi:formylglycine-generating enzyme required for sulfatase activity